MNTTVTNGALQGLNACEPADVALGAAHVLGQLIDDPLFLVDLIAKSGQLLVMKTAGRFTLQADGLLKEKRAKC